MPDLHSSVSNPLVGGTHALGVIDGEGHRLFLVNVLARFKRIDEVLTM